MLCSSIDLLCIFEILKIFLFLKAFDDEKKINLKENDLKENVTNKKYQKKINGVKNEKIKKSLLELTKVFKEK